MRPLEATGAGKKYKMHRKYEADGDNCQAMVDDAAREADISGYVEMVLRGGIRHPNVTMKRVRWGADATGKF